MKIEEIGQCGIFDKTEDANVKVKKLNELEGSDNLRYNVKIESGKYVVVLLAGFSDDSIHYQNL